MGGMKRWILGVALLGAFLPAPLGAIPDMLWLGSSGNAPLDITHYHDPLVSLTDEQIRGIAGQFRGLLDLADVPYLYPDWPGRSMSDCVSIAAGLRCEIETGNAKAFYDFHSPDSGATLHLVSADIHIESADRGLVDRLQQLMQALIGHTYTDGPNRSHWSGVHGAADLTASDDDLITRVYWRPNPPSDRLFAEFPQPLQR